jgi:hypothetical protein
LTLPRAHGVSQFFLNPQKSAFPKKAAYTQRQAQLQFFYHAAEQTFFIGGFKHGGQLTLLSARPRVKRGEELPTHRFSSLADANEYTRPSRVEAEDDLLHMWDLPDFADVSSPDHSTSTKALGQHDAEMLLSYLTVAHQRSNAGPSRAVHTRRF